MEKETKQLLKFGAESLAFTGLAASLSTLAFTRKQRLSIRNGRDSGRCQFPAEHECKGRLEVHHILPQRYAKELHFDPDYPENALTVCKNSHQMIHPDMKKANDSYKLNNESFEEALDARDEALKNKKIYWQDKWDRLMSVVAVRRTQRANGKGWKMPEKKGKKVF